MLALDTESIAVVTVSNGSFFSVVEIKAVNQKI